MGELKLLVDGRYLIPASLDERGLKEIEDSPSDDFIFLQGVKDPLFPGPTVEEIADLERRFNPERFNQIRTKAIEEIQKRFQATVNVDKINELKRSYSFMYNIMFKVMPYFVGYETRIGGEKTQGPVTFEESQVIDMVKRNVNPGVFQRYENEVKEVFNVVQIEGVGNFLEGLGREEDAWRTLKEVLDTGMIGTFVPTGKKIDDVNDLVKSLEQRRTRQIPTTTITRRRKSDWEVTEEPLKLRLYDEPPGNAFLVDENMMIELQEMNTRPNFSDNTPDRIVALNGKYLQPKKVRVRNEEVLKTYDSNLIEQAMYETLRRKVLKEEKDNLMENLTRIRDDIRKMIESKQLGLATVLLMLSNMDEFEAKGFGFERKKYATGNQYTFYVWTDEYVLRDFKRDGAHLYRFPRACVATKVRDNSVSSPYVKNNYAHPFISGYSRSDQSICLAGAGNRGRNVYDRIIWSLDTGIRVLTGGYHRNCSPYSVLSDAMYQRNKISPDDPRLKSGELKITNEVTGRLLA